MSDWIPHKRGKCPVANDAYVIVRWEGEECYGPNRADSWTWHTEDAPREYMEVETISKAYLDRLRAEVASLKETESAYYRLLEVEGSDVMVDTLNRIDDLTQQLAAANGRVEMLRQSMENIKRHAEFKDDRNVECDYVWLSGVQRGQLILIADEVNAALCNLNEDSAG
jgi:hypothetical protein